MPHESRLHDLFADLLGKGVDWCAIRGDALEGGGGRDIDLLIDEQHLPELLRVASRHGFARVPAWGHASHRFLVGYDEWRDRWIKLDVVTELAFGRGFAIRTRAAADCLRRSRSDGGVRRLSPDDEFWALMLHCTLDKGAISATERGQLSALVPEATASGPLPRAVEQLVPGGWHPDAILAGTRTGAWHDLEAAGARLAARWQRRHPVAALRSLLDAHVGVRVAKLLAPRRGDVQMWMTGGAQSDRARLADAIASSFAFPVHLATADQGPGPRRRREHLRLVIDDDTPPTPADAGTGIGVAFSLDPDADPETERRRATAAAWSVFVERWNG